MKFVKSHYIHSNSQSPFILQELKMELFVMENLRIWSILSILTLCSFRLTQQQSNSRKSKFLKVFRLPLLHKMVVWISISFQPFIFKEVIFIERQSILYLKLGNSNYNSIKSKLRVIFHFNHHIWYSHRKKIYPL